MACFILFTLAKSSVINWLQKLNFDNVTHFGFYTKKRNDFCKSILNFGYLTVGVYTNVFFEFKNIFWQSLFDEIEKTKKSDWFYIVYYFSFWIQNTVFVLILHFNSAVNVFMIKFIIFGFPIALLFQLFYQFMENRFSSIKCSHCFEENGDEKKVNQFLYKHYIKFIFVATLIQMK